MLMIFALLIDLRNRQHTLRIILMLMLLAVNCSHSWTRIYTANQFSPLSMEKYLSCELVKRINIGLLITQLLPLNNQHGKRQEDMLTSAGERRMWSCGNVCIRWK